MASFKRRIHKITPERPVGARPHLRKSTAACVIAAQNNDGVIIDARLFDCVQDLAEAEVHFRSKVGE